MTVVDDRTDEQKQTHTSLIVGRDEWLSNWGGAEGDPSYAVWACLPEDEVQVLAWAKSRSDMRNVRVAAPGWRPSTREQDHTHIYVAYHGKNHPSLQGAPT